MFKKMMMGVAAMGLLSAPAIALAPAAQAAETVSNGIAVTTNAVDAAGRDYCTLGAAGTDGSNNKVGVTAAHCFAHEPDGATIYKATGANREVRTPIGVIAHRGNYSNPVSDTSRDWLVIKFNDDVVLSSNGPGARITSTAAPLSGFINGCKDGVSSGVTCGIVTQVAPAHYRNHAFMDAGDSGGPFFVRNNQWAGINRSFTIPFGPAEYVRADKIVSDINAGTNDVGKNFVVANTP